MILFLVPYPSKPLARFYNLSLYQKNLLTFKTIQGLTNNILHFPPLCAAAVGWKTEPANRPSRAHAGWYHVTLVKLSATDFGRVQICLVHVSLFEAIVALFNDGIKKLREGLIGFFIPGDGAHGKNEWMARVIHPSLDRRVQGESTSCDFVAKFAVQSRR